MNALKEYYRSIQKLLPCSLCQKRKLMKDIRCSVDSFLQEHPDATFETVSAHFGTPQQIAESYIEEMSPQELQQQAKVKKRIVGIIAAAAACALLIWGIAVGIALVNEFANADSYTETGPIVIEEWEGF